MFFSSADANTSAGAPSAIWVTRSAEPAKFNTTVVAGWASSKSAASSVNVAFNDAAANTVIDPSRGSAVGGAGDAAGALLAQPASTTATEAATTAPTSGETRTLMKMPDSGAPRR